MKKQKSVDSNNDTKSVDEESKSSIENLVKDIVSVDSDKNNKDTKSVDEESSKSTIFMPEIGNVVKIGISTGRTFGIAYEGAIIKSEISKGVFETMKEQILVISKDNSGKCFCAKGDSGSLLVNFEFSVDGIILHPIAIIHSSKGNSTYASNLKKYLDKLSKLGIEFDIDNVQFAFFHKEKYFKIE